MPLEAGALNTERPTAVLLPTLPGMAPGVVAVRPGPKGKLYTFQCQRCFVTEEPERPISMTIHFHARSQGGANPRLCWGCRIAAYPDCTCDYCREDRTGSEYE